jgi:hypothetical protein
VVIGAPHIRVFAGKAKGSPKADAKRRTIEALEEMGELAGRHGIFLGSTTTAGSWPKRTISSRLCGPSGALG